jgi:hypothetical protein
MFIIRKILRIILKKKMRGSSLKDCRNIIHQVILYLFYRKNSMLIKRNKSIKNSFDGKRCFILFTGTSVSDFNFDLIKGEPVIACGMSVVHKDFNKCNVVGYFTPGPWEPRSLLYFDVICSGVYRSTQTGCNIFLHSTAYPHRNEITSFREQDTYYITPAGYYLSSKDIRSELHEINNIQEGSLSTGLGIASYLGFKEIYLLGQDFIGDPPIYGHFYDGYHETANSSDYESYRERTSWMIDHIRDKGCKVINVVKDEKTKSSIDSITFRGLRDLLA